MSVRRLHQIICDGCGRHAGGLFSNSVQARKASKMLKWRHIPRRPNIAGGAPTRDECPSCWAGLTPDHRWDRANRMDRLLPTRCVVCYQRRDAITAAQKCPGTEP